jgi:hypothetical protein
MSGREEMEDDDIPMGRAHPVDLWQQLLRIFKDYFFLGIYTVTPQVIITS